MYKSYFNILLLLKMLAICGYSIISEASYKGGQQNFMSFFHVYSTYFQVVLSNFPGALMGGVEVM